MLQNNNSLQCNIPESVKNINYTLTIDNPSKNFHAAENLWNQQQLVSELMKSLDNQVHPCTGLHRSHESQVTSTI